MVFLVYVVVMGLCSDYMFMWWFLVYVVVMGLCSDYGFM